MTNHTETERKRKFSKSIMILIIVIPIVVVAGVGGMVAALFHGTKTPPDYSFSGQTLTISGQFGRTIDLTDASVEYMSNGVPATPVHTNGAGLGKIERGMFSLGGTNVYKNIMDKNAQYYILITGKSGSRFYINCITPQQTEELYNGIKDVLSKTHAGFTDFPIIVGEGTAYPLDGILSMPNETSEKVPAVVLVHGSGPQDMDETIYGNKPFRDIAEVLASNGIAVIRYNKRTFTYGTELVQQFGGRLTVREETIDDAIMAAGLLKEDPRVDKDRVFILGHSLGGMLAPRIHTEGGNFAGIISLAGSPRSLLDIMTSKWR